MKKVMFGAAFAALALFRGGDALADTVTPYDGATGTGPWLLVSNTTGTPDSGIDITLSTPIAFSALSTLSATFTDLSGGAYGGSPRFVLVPTTGPDFFTVNLGTPPDFTDNSPTAFTATYSGVNLNNSSDNSQYHYSYPMTTLASLEASYGTDLISRIYFIVDGGWGSNGPQNLLLNSIDINGTNYTASPTPLPATLPMLVGGLVFVGFLARRRKHGAVSLGPIVA